MDIALAAKDNVSIVRLNGFLDTRASGDFEQAMVKLLQGGARLFAIDLTKVEMVTSAGIRVLMMVAKRIGGADRVAVWGLNEQVSVVFRIAGLTNLFPVAETEQDAIKKLAAASASAPAAAAKPVSTMTRLMSRLLGSTPPPAQAAGGSGTASQMSSTVSELLKKK